MKMMEKVKQWKAFFVKLHAHEVISLAEKYCERPPCGSCAPLAFAGWEAFPGTVADCSLKKTGSLWDPNEEEPTLEEYYTNGTSYWSSSAPIALSFHPYNRCEVWQCTNCGHPFLRYTEYGGYYEEQRIRDLRPSLIV